MSNSTLATATKVVKNAEKAYKLAHKHQKHIPTVAKVLAIVGGVFAFMVLCGVGLVVLSMMVWARTHGIG